MGNQTDGVEQVRELQMTYGLEPEDIMRALAAMLRDDAAERRHGADKVVTDAGIVDDPCDIAHARRWELQAAALEAAATITGDEIEAGDLTDEGLDAVQEFGGRYEGGLREAALQLRDYCGNAADNAGDRYGAGEIETREEADALAGYYAAAADAFDVAARLIPAEMPQVTEVDA